MQRRHRSLCWILAAALLLNVMLPGAAFAVGGDPTFEVGSGQGQQGDKGIEITISVKNNPGIASTKLSVSYDADRLELTGAKINTSLSGSKSQSPNISDNPYILNWVDGMSNYTEADWVFATLTFSIRENAPSGAANVSIIYDPDDVFDVGNENVNFTIQNGGITVIRSPINTVSAEISAPVQGTLLPSSVNCGAETYSGEVAWYEGDSAAGETVSGTTKPNQVYTAQVTLTAGEGESFASPTSVTLNGDTVHNVTPTDGKLVVTKAFERTEKADSPAAPVIMLVDKTASSITVTANSAWEYTKDDGASFQASNAFSGLQPNTEYSIKARVKETDTVRASNWSDPVTVTTDKLAQTISGPDTVTVTFGKMLDLHTKFSTNVADNSLLFTESGAKPVGTTFDSTTGVVRAGTTAGNFTVKIDANAMGSYAAAEKSITVKIESLPSPELTWQSEGNLSGTYGDFFIGKTASASSAGAITYSSSGSDIVAVEASTGALTVKRAGTATITAQVAETEAHAADSISYIVTVSTKELTITGLKATDRSYDGTTLIALTGGTLNGVVKSGEVTCTMPATGTVVSKDAGTKKTVSVVKPSLEGTNAASYTLATLPAVTVDITQADPAVGAVTYTGGDIYPSTAVSDVNAALKCTSTAFPGVLALDGVTSFTAGTRDYSWRFTPTDTTNYKAVTGMVSLTVKDDVLDHITASGTPNRTTYEYGDTFEIAGITVMAHYASGRSANITDQVSFGALSVGQSKITLNYQGKTCEVAGLSVSKKALRLSGLSWTVAGSPFTFDGVEKFVALSGTVPDGLTVSKSGDRATDAGNYTATATFDLASDYSSDYYVIVGPNPITANWMIQQAAGAAGTANIKVRYNDSTEKSISLDSFIPSDCGEVKDISVEEFSDTEHLIAAGLVADKETHSVTFRLEDLAQAKVNKSATLKSTIKTKNYSDIFVTINVTISGKDVPIVSVQDITKIYDGTAVDASDIKGEAIFEDRVVPGKWSFKEAQALTNVTDSGNKRVVFTPDDTNKYELVEAAVLVTIDKATPAGSPAYTTITVSNKTLADAALSIGTITPSGGTINWNDAATTLVSPNTSYEWTYIPAREDRANYNNLTGSIELFHVASSGGSYTPPVVTVPASGDAGSVSITVTTSGSSAIIGAIDKADLKKVADATSPVNVNIDLSKLGNAIDRVKLNSSVIKAITDAANTDDSGIAGLDVKLPSATISINATILDTIKRQYNNVNITLSVESVKTSSLAPEQQTIVQSLTSPKILDVCLLLGDKHTSGFEDGAIKIAVPYSLPDGKSGADVTVNYMDSIGLLTPVECSYDTNTKTVIFLPPHFSHYVISSDGKATPRICDGGEGCPTKTFDDVDVTAWYHEAIDYVIENGLMSGYSNSKFAPLDDLSRSMLCQILYNRESRPALTSILSFEDVDENHWYADAVRWAASAGYVLGYGNNMFGPNDTVTREQLATIFWRFSGEPAINKTDGLDSFADKDEVSPYAQTALKWCVQQEIIGGQGNGKLNPRGQATRAEAAAMLIRLFEHQK